MKTQTLTTPVEETLSGDSVKMSIDSNSIDYLMHNLTNLYADPAAAVVREYTSNAYDSHVRAGETRPVEITVEGLTFTVEDFGVGMSKQEIVDIYSKYGLSTKNNTNSEIGAFGLGAKSALAIADRFDIVARKNGVETVAYVQKNSKGVGVVHFVSETETTQPDGFKVSVKSEKFRKLFNTSEGQKEFHLSLVSFPAGVFKINDIPVESVEDESWAELTQEGETLGWFKSASETLTPNGSEKDDFFGVKYSVGGVLYSYDSSVLEGVKLSKIVNTRFPQFSIIINLPIGSVDLTPSRESVMATERSEQTIKVVAESFTEQLDAKITETMSGLTVDGFIQFVEELATAYYSEKEYSYKGETIPTSFPNEKWECVTVEKRNSEPAPFIRPYGNRQYLSMYTSYAKGYIVQVDDEVLDDFKNPQMEKKVSTLGKEAAYYNKSTMSGHPNMVQVVKKSWLETAVPNILRENRKIYTHDEFVGMVAERRTEVRKEAAANRKTGETRKTKTGIVLPAAKVSNTDVTVLHPTNVETISGDKIAYIDVFAENSLSSVIPVFGWSYNNGGVELARNYSRKSENNHNLVRKALDGWWLIVIPARRKTSTVRELYPNMVPASNIIHEWLEEQHEIFDSESLALAHTVRHSSNHATGLNVEKLATLYNYSTQNHAVFVNKATEGLIRKASQVSEMAQTRNYREPILVLIDELKSWGVLDGTVVEQAKEFETKVEQFFQNYPLLNTSLYSNILDSMVENGTFHHVVDYVNNVNKP